MENLPDGQNASWLNNSVKLNFQNGVSAEFATSPYERALIPIPILFSAYLTTAAITYVVKQEKVEKTMAWTNVLGVIAPFFHLLMLCFLCMDVYNSNAMATICRHFKTVVVSFNGVTKVAVFGALWLRQWTLHKNPVFKFNPLLKKIVAVMSCVSLLGLVLNPIAQAVLTDFRPAFFKARGCVLARGTSPISIGGSYIVYSACQIMLLILALIPLVTHLRHNMLTRAAPIHEAVKRISACTSVAVACDVSFLAVGLTSNAYADIYSISFVPFLMGFNSLISIAGLLFSFKNYRERIFPFKAPRVASLPPADNATCTMPTQGGATPSSQKQSSSVVVQSI